MTIAYQLRGRREPQWNKKTNAFHGGGPIAGSTLRSDKQKAAGVEHRERRAKKQRKVKNEGKLSLVCFFAALFPFYT